MNEQLLRIDVSNVKDGVYKFLYTVPANNTFVVSRVDTSAADIVRLKINGRVISDKRNSDTAGSFFNGLVLNAGDEVYVTVSMKGGAEIIAMSGSLLDNN